MNYFILTIAIVTSIAPCCMAERYAFLVAVRQYKKTELNSLRFTERDIVALRDQLLKSGYDKANIVTLTQSLGAKDARFLPLADNIRTELGLVLQELTSNDSIVLAFSGHGVQFKNEKDAYFCPMNASLTDRKTLISLGDAFSDLANPRKCRAKSRVLLVDACRNNPRTKLSKSTVPVELEPVGLRAPEPTGGVVALYSCSEGQRSWESPTLRHGVFFNYVIQALGGDADFDRDGIIDVPELEKFVTKRVQRYARVELAMSQTPERRGSSRGIIELVNLKPASEPTRPLPSKKNAKKAWPKEYTNTLGMKFILCPAGEFTMGSPVSDKYADYNEKPQVRVKLTKQFYLGKFEVTQRQWREIMGNEPWKKDKKYVIEGDDVAATCISWEDAREFCKRLTRKEGKSRKYRLPTEAEWEYACRAGTRTRFSFGNDESKLGDYAWWGGISGNGNAEREQYAHQVGTKRDNPWGFYDMHGNVWEWCEDLYQNKLVGGTNPLNGQNGSSRVSRGGGWSDYWSSCRSAYRFSVSPGYLGYILGFRVALVPAR